MLVFQVETYTLALKPEFLVLKALIAKILPRSYRRHQYFDWKFLLLELNLLMAINTIPTW